MRLNYDCDPRRKGNNKLLILLCAVERAEKAKEKLSLVENEYEDSKKAVEDFVAKLDKAESERKTALKDLENMQNALVSTSKRLTITEVKLAEIERKANDVEEKFRASKYAKANENVDDKKNNATGDNEVVGVPEDQDTLSPCCAQVVK